MAEAPQPPTEHPFDRLQSLLLNMSSLDSVLTELARVASGVVGPTACGITMRYNGNLLTVGSSDARAEALDETQYRAGEGPCLEALRTGQIVEVVDARQDTRWPRYMPTAIAAGVRCSLSLPLADDSGTGGARAAGGAAFGAMNIYGFDQPRMFTAPDRRHLELFAARAAGTLQVARRLIHDSALFSQMDTALNSRSVIDQALGIIMGQQRCTATTAFDLLRQQSSTSHRRIRDIAADLVEHTTGHSPQAGRAFNDPT